MTIARDAHRSREISPCGEVFARLRDGGVQVPEDVCVHTLTLFRRLSRGDEVHPTEGLVLAVLVSNDMRRT